MTITQRAQQLHKGKNDLLVRQLRDAAAYVIHLLVKGFDACRMVGVNVQSFDLTRQIV